MEQPPQRICPQCRETTSLPVCPNDGYDTVIARAATDDWQLEPGSVFAKRFEIVRQIRRGAAGDRFVATQLESGATVTLTLVDRSLMRVPGVAERLEAIGGQLKSVSHPGLMRVVDCGMHGAEVGFWVTEWTEGAAVDEFVKQSEQPLSAGAVVKLGEQLFEAIAELHRRGMVHGNITAQNVILTRGGSVVRLGESGIASFANGDAGTARRVGEPAYLAPEVSRGSPVTGKADIYAAGAVLYELLTGSKPYEERSSAEYLIAHASKPIPEPRREGAVLTGRLPDAVKECLRKDPMERPSATRVLDLLQRARRSPLVEETLVKAADQDSKSRPAPSRVVSSGRTRVVSGVSRRPTVVPPPRTRRSEVSTRIDPHAISIGVTSANMPIIRQNRTPAPAPRDASPFIIGVTSAAMPAIQPSQLLRAAPQPAAVPSRPPQPRPVYPAPQPAPQAPPSQPAFPAGYAIGVTSSGMPVIAPNAASSPFHDNPYAEQNVAPGQRFSTYAALPVVREPRSSVPWIVAAAMAFIAVAAVAWALGRNSNAPAPQASVAPRTTVTHTAVPPARVERAVPVKGTDTAEVIPTVRITPPPVAPVKSESSKIVSAVVTHSGQPTKTGAAPVVAQAQPTTKAVEPARAATTAQTAPVTATTPAPVKPAAVPVVAPKPVDSSPKTTSFIVETRPIPAPTTYVPPVAKTEPIPAPRKRWRKRRRTAPKPRTTAPRTVREEPTPSATSVLAELTSPAPAKATSKPATKPAEIKPAPAAPKKIFRRVLVDSNPKGASVYLGGRMLGKTPYTVSWSDPDKVVIVKIKKKGYRDYPVQLSHRVGDRRFAHLEPLTAAATP